MKIDAHHHFWTYNTEEFGWIDDGMARIRRDFLPADLLGEIQNAGVDGVISVQARQSLAETDWLLAMAGAHDWIKGVVGWVPLASPGVEQDLARLSRQPKLKSVRHVVQGEPDERFLARPDFNRGVSLLKSFGLAYDILIFEHQLPAAIDFVDRHPDQVFVLDHIAKPRIRDRGTTAWHSLIGELARRPRVYCKLSGLVTEADPATWTPAQLRPYAERVLEAFGPSRLMFGSDWPVCLVACGYQQWLDTVTDFISTLSQNEQARIWGGTAADAYRLKEIP